MPTCGTGGGGAGSSDEFEEVDLPPMPPRRMGVRRDDSDLIRFSEPGDGPPPHPSASASLAENIATDAADALRRQCALITSTPFPSSQACCDVALCVQKCRRVYKSNAASAG